MKNDFQKNDKKVTPPANCQKKQEPQNCWEYFDCLEEMKKECSAYRGKIGKQCWLVCNVSKKNKTVREDTDCINCEWYKKINQNENEN